MYTINTIEDLIGALDENPEWVDALRTRLLTSELLDLPEKFTGFVAEMNAFVAETKKFVAEMNAFVAEMNVFVAETKKFVAEMNAFVAEMNAFVVKVNEFIEATNKRFEAIENRLDKVESRLDGVDKRLDRLENSVGVLKGGHARTSAIGNAALIALDMGFEMVGTVPQQKIISLVESRDPADIPKNERRSFYSADLIVEALDKAGETCYLAVEISFTANGRDTRRAIRNAAFLTRFTGKRAYPAVAGMYRDNRIQNAIESGDVFWFQLDAEDLEVE